MTHVWPMKHEVQLRRVYMTVTETMQNNDKLRYFLKMLNAEKLSSKRLRSPRVMKYNRRKPRCNRLSRTRTITHGHKPKKPNPPYLYYAWPRNISIWEMPIISWPILSAPVCKDLVSLFGYTSAQKRTQNFFW